jgi:hypothetical protein
MRRVAVPEPTTGRRAGGRRDPRHWPTAAAFAAALALAVLALYLAHPLLQGIRLPIGPDGPVYVWWARYAEAAGTGAVPRPGIPALTLFLGAPVGASPLQVVAVLGPVMAAVVALAGAATVETLLGPNRLRTWAAGLLAGGFAGHLAPGWLANLALVALFLGAVAALGTVERSWRPVSVAGGLLAAGVMVHSAFLVVGLAVLAGAVLLLGPDAIRRLRGGEPPGSLAPLRIGVAAGLGAGAGFLGLAALGAPAAVPGSTSQDHLLRRLGGEGFLRDRYRERLGEDLERLAAPLIAGGALGAAGVPRRLRGTGERLFWGVAASWAAVTVGGLLFLHLTDRGPASRLLTFAFVVPLVAAAGVARLWNMERALARASAMAVGLILLGGSLWGWYRQGPFIDAEELGAARAAGLAVESLPRGTPLVFLVDTRELAAGFHIARFGNVLRSGLPAGRIGDVHLVVGGPGPFLSGEAGAASGDPEYVHLAERTLEEVERVRDRAAVLVVRPFNEPGYDEAVALGREVAPDVAQVDGPPARRAVSPGAPQGLGASALIGLSVAALALLVLGGGGWARWGLPGASLLGVASLAPAAGLAIGVVAALAADGLGFGSDGPLAWAIAVALAALGYGLSLRAGDDPIDRLEDP